MNADWTAEEVEVRTFLGDDVLGDAELYVQSAKSLWNATFTTSADGMRTVRLWQPGEFGYLLSAAEVSGFGGTVQLHGTHAEVRVPSRTIEGKVVDSATEEPLAGVHVLLSNRHGGRTATSGADGAFRFAGVKPGVYRLAGGGERGLSHEVVQFEVTEQMANRLVRLELRRRPELELELITAHGTPASGATVIELAGNAVASLREADEGGRVRLPAACASLRSIVVLTLDGSLHAQPLAAGENQSALRVTIPPPTSAISITIESTADHEPIAGVSLAMRVNGVLFPDEVMQLIADRAGLLLKSASNGRIRLARVPGGTYEFWPVRSRSDVEAFMRGQLGAAPVVLIARPGENVAKLTFARVAPRAGTP